MKKYAFFFIFLFFTVNYAESQINGSCLPNVDITVQDYRLELVGDGYYSPYLVKGKTALAQVSLVVKGDLTTQSNYILNNLTIICGQTFTFNKPGPATNTTYDDEKNITTFIWKREFSIPLDATSCVLQSEFFGVNNFSIHDDAKAKYCIIYSLSRLPQTIKTGTETEGAVLAIKSEEKQDARAVQSLFIPLLAVLLTYLGQKRLSDKALETQRKLSEEELKNQRKIFQTELEENRGRFQTELKENSDLRQKEWELQKEVLRKKLTFELILMVLPTVHLDKDDNKKRDEFFNKLETAALFIDYHFVEEEVCEQILFTEFEQAYNWLNSKTWQNGKDAVTFSGIKRIYEKWVAHKNE